ncbi:hypothetical protein HanHA300_Chr07g0246971 [Helianthus annuus]|nr:hypothetical protein HanHA300_Chr07g0246971 [Helianthus annuus]KAJ0563541.1 hypothetical protein HanHA89_Chr07g0264331 [Helianthus annuus]KAJ0728871.1 hypothetical protein HanLR1_Chr07g0246611 [Helianthus annuus]KAJ0731640.1 hypothetical protein HanOQP8_Chr07g0254281 [Helianthus annuus]
MSHKPITIVNTTTSYYFMTLNLFRHCLYVVEMDTTDLMTLGLCIYGYFPIAGTFAGCTLLG